MEYPFFIALGASAIAALALSCGSVAELETPLPEPMDGSDTSTTTEGGVDVDASLGSDEAEGSDSAADLSEPLTIDETGDSAPEAVDEVDSVDAVESGSGCLNGLQDGNEQGPDCGGECPLKCPGTPCVGPEECITESCASGVCSAPCVDKLALGFWHACALKRDGTLWCWGHNSSGQLGTGSFSDIPVKSPVPTTGLPGTPAQISLGSGATYALLPDGTVWAWGSNDSGQLGDGTTTGRAVPAQVTTLDNAVVQIAAGGSQVCALTADSALWCWGFNIHGQVGDGTTVDKTTPVEIAVPGGKVTQVRAGAGHTCALLDNGSVYCWGENAVKQLGTGAQDFCVPTPAPVLGLPGNVIDIQLGEYVSSALTATGELLFWGEGPGQKYPKPKALTGFPTAMHSLAAGQSTVCALDTSGTPWCWGGNGQGQISNKKTKYPDQTPGSPCLEISYCYEDSLPQPKSGIGPAVSQLNAKHGVVCAITVKGELWCWGANEYGQVGDGTINKNPCDICTHPQPGKVLLSCE